MQKIYVKQDGGDFYLSARRDGERYRITAPMRVRDYCLEEAKHARMWFEAHAREHDFQPIYQQNQ